MSDLISREAVRDLMYHNQAPLDEYDLDSIQSIDATPVVHGYWIDHELGFLKSHTTCSNCGFDKDGLSHPNYCEQCGAKMDKKKD